jgi:energy-coupling factor transport system ATP-binding protein
VVLGDFPLAPPVVELGRWAGWSPLPLTIRDARRAAAGLRADLAESVTRRGTPTSPRPHPAGTPRLAASGVAVRHGAVEAVGGVDLTLHDGEVVALMGRNGSGKSSLLWALHGSVDRAAGEVWATDAGGRAADPAALAPRLRRRTVGLVPQSAPDLLYLDTVAHECAQADRESEATPGTTRGYLDRLAPGTPADTHPRDLSEGQQLALVLAVQLAGAPRALLLDEPTRGLDHPGKEALTRLLRDLAADGFAVAVATHDVEFAAAVADRVLVMAQGRLVADGPARQVLADSPEFAPQVAKVLAPLPLLTVAEVVALAEGAGTLTVSGEAP